MLRETHGSFFAKVRTYQAAAVRRRRRKDAGGREEETVEIVKVGLGAEG